MSLVSEMVRRASGGGLDKPAAALAALVAGAAVFVMPAYILEQAVLASGLPDTLPQLSPPLGIKSRAGLALLAAGSAFGMVLLMMRILGFFTRKSEQPAPDKAAMPRVRRRDQHPDAPFRGPLSVSRDLGEPAAAAAPEPIEVPAPWPEPQPASAAAEPARPARPAGLSTRRRAPLIEVLAGGVPEDVEPAPEPAAEEPRRIKAGRDAEQAMAQPEAPAAVEEPAAFAQAEPEQPFVGQIEPEPKPEPIVVATPAPVAPAPSAWAPPAAEPAQESLTQLLARFERALERNSTRHAPAAAALAAADEPETDEGEGMDLRLRSALENLRKFAPRHG